MFSYKNFWIITLIILLVVYILGKSKYLLDMMQVKLGASLEAIGVILPFWMVSGGTWIAHHNAEKR